MWYDCHGVFSPINLDSYHVSCTTTSEMNYISDLTCLSREIDGAWEGGIWGGHSGEYNATDFTLQSCCFLWGNSYLRINWNSPGNLHVILQEISMSHLETDTLSTQPFSDITSTCTKSLAAINIGSICLSWYSLMNGCHAAWTYKFYMYIELQYTQIREAQSFMLMY